MNTLEYAKRYLAVGVNVLPIQPDGSKAPAEEFGTWGHLQNRMMTIDEVPQWFGNGNGVAAIGGAISGHLVDFDFDDALIFERWKELIVELLGQDFWDRLLIVRTPRPGFTVINPLPFWCWALTEVGNGQESELRRTRRAG